MYDHIFRKYDIRGIVGKDLLLEEVYAFGRALAYYFLERNCNLNHVLVAMDGRLHSPAIKDELVRALCDSGVQVVFCGICPTPVVYFALHTTPAAMAAVMITASHNGKEYNGFKICYGKDLITAPEIIKLRDYYKQKREVVHAGKGGISVRDVVAEYLAWFESAFVHLKKSSIAAIIDCGNAASATVIPHLVRRMEWENVHVMYDTVDGNFPHHVPDPTKAGVLTALQEALKSSFAQNVQPCGIAFDGDADRVVAMTHQGKLLVGDSLLALLSEDMKKTHPHLSVVFDGKCSQVLSSSLRQWNVPFYMTATGYAFVKEKMVETGALLAGELSSHLMFADRYFGYDDGIYAMMRLFEILEKTGQSLDALFSRFPQSYTTGEVRLPCAEQQKQTVVDAVYAAFIARSDVIMSTLDGVRIDADYGWGIVRASNTEPVISFSCESMTPEGFERIKKDFTTILDAML